MGGRKDAGTVKVVGLGDLRKELRKLDEKGILGDLKEANYAVGQLVVRRAQARANTRLLKAAMASLSASRQAARAQVSGGGRDAPFFGGAEFGAMQNQRRNTTRGLMYGWNQFEPWRGNGGDAGYALYPAIREATDEIVELYGDAMEQITSKAFPT